MIWFILVITAVVFVVIETILEKKALSDARTFNFTAMFAFGNAIISIPLLLVADLTPINWQILILIYIASVFSTITSLLIFKVIKHESISEVAPILAILPLVVSLFAYLILGETLSLFQASGLILMVGGILILEFSNYKYSNGIFRKGRKKYILYIILSLILGAIGVIFDKALLSNFNVNPLAYLALIQLFIGINYIFFIGIKPKLFPSFKSDLSRYWQILILIALSVVIHRYLYLSAIKIAASAGLVVAVFKLSALFNVFVGKKFFAETGILKKVLATFVVLVGLFMLILN
jgi:drug/metabolite transporter (DMT)-like permease